MRRVGGRFIGRTGPLRQALPPRHRLRMPRAQRALRQFERTLSAEADGLADPSTGRIVTADDPVRVASISKLVVSVGVMKLVEQGKLDLDRDASGYLGWELRNPAFASRPITLRQLLSHTSSVRDHHDEYAIPLGDTVQSTMAAPTSWDPRHGPGSGCA